MKGDWVVMNTQPTLHRPFMTGFRVVPQDVKTFKFFLSVTKPFDANFDGDEINCHVLQNPMTTTVVKELMATPFHILSPKKPYANNLRYARCHGEYGFVDKEKEADREINVHAIFGGSRSPE